MTEMSSSKTPKKPLKMKSIDSQETVDELKTQIKVLETQEDVLDKQIKNLEAEGVKEADYTNIMNALHEFNELRDSIGSVFEFMANVTNGTIKDLYNKYNIPIE